MSLIKSKSQSFNKFKSFSQRDNYPKAHHKKFMGLNPNKWHKHNVITFLILFVITFLVVLGLSFLGAFGPSSVDPLAPPGTTAVSSSNSYATQAGIDILQSGGNYIDAMVAVHAVLAVTEPFSSGLGGFSVILGYKSKDKSVFHLDGMVEQSAYYNHNITSSFGGITVGIPGTVSALVRALEDNGTMSLQDCFSFAISLARNGYKLNAYGAAAIAANKDIISKFPATAALFLDDNGQPRRVGTTMKNPDLANTLESIARNPNIFYSGIIAQAMIQTVRDTTFNPGNLTLDDFQGYKAVYRDPVAVSFDLGYNYTVWGTKTPTNGGIYMGLALNILQNFKRNITNSWMSSEALQAVLNTQSLAIVDTYQYSGDGDWVDNLPWQGLLDKGYANRRSALINFTKGIINVTAGNPTGNNQSTPLSEIFQRLPSTTHFSIVDRDGNMVAVTASLGDFFGSGMVVPGRGFLLNNLLQGPMEAGRKLRRTALKTDNVTVGAKRPSFPVNPTIVLQDSIPYIALGSAGNGNNIPGNTLTTLLKSFTISISEAVSSARYLSFNDGVWRIESQLRSDVDLVNKLSAVGMSLSNLTGFELGGVNIVKRNPNGKAESYADARRQGGSSQVY